MANQKWGHKAEYILTLMGFNVGVGAIWKFPYLCARNGGGKIKTCYLCHLVPPRRGTPAWTMKQVNWVGSYMIPYLLFVLILAIPLTYLEMFLGQFIQKGAMGAWDICPAVKGLAAGSCLLSGLFSIYYSTFFAWILYYLYFSFFPQLPWTQCGQSWNSPGCVEDFNLSHSTSGLQNIFRHGDINNTVVFNSSLKRRDDDSQDILLYPKSNYSRRAEIPAAEEFFRNNVLEITGGLHDMGTLRWPLLLCLAATFLCVYICIIRGIRFAGKVVYVTVLCPYFLVTVILIRALTLPGSVDGILFYITPNFERLQDFEVWMEACSFALFAPGLTYGVIIKMAAHNPRNTNCYRDSILVNIICALSQVYFGFSVFGITGHLAYRRGVTMEHYKTSGFKLGFITYPEATSYLPLPQLWSVFLFLMLFTLGIDSLIPTVESVTDTIGEIFPRVAKRRWFLNAVVMVPFFLLAVPYTTQGGVYLLTLVEWFAFFPSLVVFAILECVAAGWIFGIPHMNEAMKLIWGTKVPKGMGVMWKFICPAILVIIFGYSLYSYRPPQFEDYIYPGWANVIGWLISATIVLPLPACFVWSVWKAPGFTVKEKLTNVCKPRGKWDIEITDANTNIEMQEDEASLALQPTV